jgi:hypothetical protein
MKFFFSSFSVFIQQTFPEVPNRGRRKQVSRTTITGSQSTFATSGKMSNNDCPEKRAVTEKDIAPSSLHRKLFSVESNNTTK